MRNRGIRRKRALRQARYCVDMPERVRPDDALRLPGAPAPGNDAPCLTAAG